MSLLQLLLLWRLSTAAAAAEGADSAGADSLAPMVDADFSPLLRDGRHLTRRPKPFLSADDAACSPFRFGLPLLPPPPPIPPAPGSRSRLPCSRNNQFYRPLKKINFFFIYHMFSIKWCITRIIFKNYIILFCMFYLYVFIF